MEHDSLRGPCGLGGHRCESSGRWDCVRWGLGRQSRRKRSGEVERETEVEQSENQLKTLVFGMLKRQVVV
jgi:hypothetical protein